jgi:nucleoside-diphosphate-sugar epimerase
MEYRRGDVRDEDALRDAFTGADVVMHLAFMIVGSGSEEMRQAINVDGTLNAFRAAAAAGVRRFVYASSVFAYGFHPDNPIGMTEEWPVREAARLPYARNKAELERLLHDEAEAADDLELYLLRPPFVVGPHTIGGKNTVPAPVAGAGGAVLEVFKRLRLPVLTPDIPLQLVHEEDMGRALLLCAVGAGPPGDYNIAADGVLTVSDLARELGIASLAVPAGAVHAAARVGAKVPMPGVGRAATDWLEAVSHPVIIDATKAKHELGWRPRYSGMEALRATVRGAGGAT